MSTPHEAYKWQQGFGNFVDRKLEGWTRPSAQDKGFTKAFKNFLTNRSSDFVSASNALYNATPLGVENIKVARAQGGPGATIPSRFKTPGSVLSAFPLKSLKGSYMGMAAFGFGMEVLLQGKPLSFGTAIHSAWNAIPVTLSMELAGNNTKGIFKSLGWGLLGGEMGLGLWGSLGLQAVGQTLLPGLGLKLTAGVAAYKAGKALYAGAKNIYNMGMQSRTTEFGSGDTSYMSSEAGTMRQRSVAAIERSHLDLNNILGNEARMLMG